MSTVRLGTAERPLRVAVIGAGPSGFYATAALLGSDLEVEVDLFDRLPAPFGLVRGGVAPDHQKIKSVVRAYEKTASHPRFRFFGNVRVGADLTLEVLRRHYDQLCFAVGCESSRAIGIPGEDLAGSASATDFVGWYNGHPDACHHCFDLDETTSVAIVGVGNVAVDVARILTRDPDELATTDIADYALDVLRRSRVRDVYMLGRRGPVQAAFTPVELKELSELAGVDLVVPEWAAYVDPISQAWLDEQGDKATRKNVALLQSLASRAPTGAPRRIHLLLYRSPVEVLGDEKMTGVRVEHTELVGPAADRLRAQSTGKTDDIEAGMMFRAVGYRGIPLPGLPFDERRGVVSNEGGRVTDPEGAVVAGTYVVGWAKRGPSGVIGTNRADANETVARMLEDIAGQEAPRDPDRTAEAALDTVAAAVPELVQWADWKRIDAEEVARGEAAGRVRGKFTHVADMLALLKPG